MRVLLSRIFRRFFPSAEIIHVRRMSDAQLLAAVSVESGHPMFQAFMELIDRSRNEARTQAKNVIASDRETVFALGAEYGLDKLEEYLLWLRVEGMRQRAERERMEAGS